MTFSSSLPGLKNATFFGPTTTCSPVLGIARYAAAALTGGKGPEPPDFHSAALTHCLENAFKDGLDDSSPFSA